MKLSTASEAGGKLDVLIVGGGPAGLSALLWCQKLRLDVLLFERSREYGGQLLSIHNPISNYPGRTARDGREFCRHFRDEITGISASGRLNCEAASIDVTAREINLTDGTRMQAENLVIATGVRRRKLGIPGESEFEGRGILDSGAKERLTVVGKRALIAGGGDAAIENALILSEHAESVTVVHRRGELRARKEFINRAARTRNIALLLNSRITEIRGDDSVRSVAITDENTGRTVELAVEFVLVRIGFEPNSELVRGELDLDQNGFVLIDAFCRSSASGVYAIGDVANPISPTIVSAAGMGATAAKAIFGSL